MAKFAFYEINSMIFDKDIGDGKTEELTVDSVTLQFTKRVNRSNMAGDKGEEYKIPIVDLPFLFVSDVKFPGFAGRDSTARVAAVKAFLDKYIGKTCTLEEISKNNRKIISYLEFE